MSIFPFLQQKKYIPAEKKPLPLFVDVKWDATARIPVISQGEPVMVSGIEALIGWAARALQTARYVEECRSWQYGCEIQQLIGRPWRREAVISEARRYVIECLTANPYITNIENIVVRFADSTLTVSFIMRTVYGTTTLKEVEIGA